MIHGYNDHWVTSYLEIYMHHSYTKRGAKFQCTVFEGGQKRSARLSWGGQILSPHDFRLCTAPHELKIPGKEIIKAPTWGSIHNNLPPLVALS